MKNMKPSKTDKSYQSARQNPQQLSKTSLQLNTQALTQIEDIVDGLILTTDGRIVSMLEILPINFEEKTAGQKKMTADAFGDAFKMLPKHGQFKILNINTNLDTFEAYVMSFVNKEPENAWLKRRASDYIENLKTMQRKFAVSKRFFYIHEYTGDERGNKTSDFEEIKRTMRQQQKDAYIALTSMGNAVIDLSADAITLAEVFYQFFNPSSSKTESINDRIEHIVKSAALVGKTATVADAIAPRGIRFGKWDYAVIDGVYHSYYTLRDVSFPQKCRAGWLTEIVRAVPNGDVDIFYDEASISSSDFILDRTDVISQGVASRYADEQNKQEEYLSRAYNAKYIKQCRDNGDEVYEVCVMVTLRANSFKEMQSNTKTFKKIMKTCGYFFDSCLLQTQKFYEMALPLVGIKRAIFSQNRRNMPNSSIASLYPFSTYEMFDEHGYALGETAGQHTLFSIDIFDKSKFTNPHIFIAGMPGSGKTVTELALTSRMRIEGVKVMYILPLKGHEYKKCIRSLGGSFISLQPGGKNCVNICEIRPQGVVNASAYREDEDLYEELKNKPSLLATKVTSLVTWVRMLMGEYDKLTRSEAGVLNSVFYDVYAKFGITDDNLSIYEPNTHRLKRMPIIGDLLNGILENGTLTRVAEVLQPWVNGNCANMNGQTNVDLDNRCIAFDTNEDYIGEELLPAFMFIAFEICYAIASRDVEEKCAITLDETWKFLMIPECAKHIKKMVKILRAYKTSMITATQDIEDSTQSEDGRSLITQSATKVFLKMNKDELNAIRDCVTMSAQNEELIQSLPTGYGYFCMNNDRVLVKVAISKLELALYDPSVPMPP